MLWLKYAIVTAAVGSYYNVCCASVALTAIALYIAVLYWYEVRLILRTMRRDVLGMKRFLSGGVRLRRWRKNNMTVVGVFAEIVNKYPDKAMFLFGDDTWTFRQADEFSNRVANHFARKGLKAGDDVALMMGNCPEMVLLWLGLAKIGVASALINCNLKKTPLRHSISTVKAKAVIFSSDMVPRLVEVVDDLRQSVNAISFHCYGQHDQLEAFPAEDIETALPTASSNSLSFRGNISDTLLYVFTSGTTGLPKAAIIKNHRFLMCAMVGGDFAGTKDDDVMYIYLPLYHTAAGILGVSQTLVHGTTSVIARKFSASHFWADCIRYRCTVTQYIGEICRYLYMQPPKAEDRQHSIRLMYGNGLRAQMWPEFVERFGIADIKELYGSTEGNANIMNMDNRIGSVGFIPTIFRLSPAMASLAWHRYVIRVDSETGEPLRDANGLCILAGPNEPGEWVAAIHSSIPETAFDGYTDESSTMKKIYRDVIRKGDRCFGTGDIMLYDDDGYIFFRDRTGDTFRWKGENVSTTEVEGIINKYAVECDCVVFGVEVPHTDGKAGMVAIHDAQGDLDVERVNELLNSIRTELPAYAIPVFVRATSEIEMTGSFKLPKTTLLREGYDTNVVRDPLYLLHPTKKAYVPFDASLYGELVAGKLRM